MIDVTKIWDRLFLGSLLDAERLGRGNPLGISAVISLSETAPCNTRREITYIHVPIDDAQPIPVDQFDAIMRAIADHIRSGKVLIHCGSGVSRAPVITAAWMHLAGHQHFDAALKEIARLRPFINPSAILVASVKAHLR
jgi:protein-tyrosine phosphatase